MEKKQNLRAPLHIHMTGPAVKNHRIPINDFIFLAHQVQVALHRVAQVLLGSKVSVHRGPKPADIKKYCSLEIVDISAGSLSLLCDLPPKDDLFEDLGVEALGAMVQGIGHLESKDELPYGYDEGVLLALRESGEVFARGIDKIEYDFLAPGAKKHTKAAYTQSVNSRLIRRIKEPIENSRSIEGRLLMGDFRESAYKCRLHPAVGKAVTCSFEEHQKEIILEALTHHVRLTGETVELEGQINEFKIRDIELLETDINLQIQEKTFFDRTFTLEELAETQGVSKVTEFSKLLGDFWPEEEKADAFIAQVHEWRREGKDRNSYQ